jgi:hypothetical protein
LAESVRFNDYDWFTPADLSRVIDAIHALPDWKSVVLVGGQSLTAWVEYYKIELPAFEGPYLTIDADFLGTKTEAEVIAKELGSKAQIPGIDDHTPNAATIDFTGASGKKLHIDILTGVLGLKSDDVRKLAVNLEIDNNKLVPVLHPLLVLESRCTNLQRLSEKRHGNGITQARVACTVVEHYLAECLAMPERHREAFKASKRIANIAQTSAGVFVWKEWRIDVVATVDASKMPGEFNRSWPYELAETARKREIASRATAKISTS